MPGGGAGEAQSYVLGTAARGLSITINTAGQPTNFSFWSILARSPPSEFFGKFGDIQATHGWAIQGFQFVK
jgi:hypothetical protein